MTNEPVAPPADDRVPIGMIIAGAICASVAFGVSGLLVGAAWEWTWGWIAAVLVLMAVPPALLALGMSGFVIRGTMSWFLVPKRQIELVATDTTRTHIVGMNQRELIESGRMAVDARDLEMFITQSLPVKDWTQKRWAGTLMVSGHTCDTRYHAAMMEILKRAGVIINYSKGSTGDLAIPDPADAMRRCGITTG